MTQLLSSTAQDWPSPRYSWYLVSLLTVTYIFSFVDRFILGLLIEPIQQELGLSDTQAGLLLGPAFAAFYVLMGLPLGWLADRKRRTFIIAAGLAVWSFATLASGLMRSFLGLFLARMSVGAGEATLSPCAMSLMADCFPKEKRGKPIAFYSMAVSLGAGVAALTGAAVIGWATTAGTVTLPFFGDLSPWRVSLIAVGLPGLLLVPLVLFLREPKRMADTLTTGAKKPGYAEVFQFLKPRWAGFAGFVAVFSYVIMTGFSTSWGAAAFARTWGWTPVQYGQAIGLIFLAFGPITVYFGGWLSDKLFQKGYRSAPMIVGLAGVPIMMVFGIAWPLMPTATSALIPLTLMIAGVALSTATGVTALLNIIPSNIRGQSVALYYMVTALFGQAVGPVFIGWTTQTFLNPDEIRYAMALLPLMFGLPLIVAAPWILKRYRRMFDDVNRTRASSVGIASIAA